MEKMCVKCGRKPLSNSEKYCSSCGNKIVEKRQDFVRSQCRMCGKPIMAYKDASQHLCDYHWSVFDANDGY